MPQGLKIGSLLDHGKYRIEKVLGQGGFGITYLALDTNTHSELAIKEYFPKIYCHRAHGSTKVRITHNENSELVAKGRDRFLKEAKNLKKLDNSDIVKAYATFEENQTAYYVMEYINGEPLQRMFENKGVASIELVVRIMDQLCYAVSYIHSKKITHYDLKPQNILIRASNGRPVIIDFGLSKQFDSKGGAESSLMYAYSDGYSPIELYGQTYNENVFSPQTDVYSLGGILYFMLTGQRPPGASLLQNTSLPQANISAYIYKVLQKAMSYNKTERYDNVIAFKKDFDIAAKGEDPFPINEDTDLIHINGNPKTDDLKVTPVKPQEGEDNSNNHGSENIIRQYWWLIVLVIIAAVVIKFSVDDNKENTDIVVVTDTSPKPDQPPAPTAVREPDISPAISTYATRNFTLRGYNYTEKFNLRADNGVLYVSSNENGHVKSDNFKYTPNIDAEKILDQFEGLANFWAACNVGEYIINDNGFYSEEVMNSTLNFLKKSMEYMSVKKGNCPAAYEGAKSRYDMLRAIHKDWENSPSFKDEWEQEIEMIIYGMGENPITAKDILGL